MSTPSQPTTHTIDRLGHLGDGVAPGPVFVPRALPGEVVEGEVIDGRMDVPRIVTPSPDRVKASCPHYNTCGGCSLLHASDAFVSDWKSNVVRQALVAQGIETEIRPIATSPATSRRRATLSARRGKKGAIVGFHGRRSGAISSIEHCQMLAPELVAQVPTIEALVYLGGSRKAELSVNMATSEGGIDMSVMGGKALNRTLETELAQVLHKFGLARLSWNGELIATEVAPQQAFGQAMVTPPPGAFLQATKDGEAVLVAAVREAIGGADTVVDLFAGSGTFSLPLADQSEVHAVEGSDAMMQALDHGWRRSKGLKRVTSETRDLFRRPLMPDELNKFAAIVIDPPRAGALAQVEEIAQSDVAHVAMVSCNPVSFARDAQILVAAGYRCDWVLPVDQFRWSSHVELMAAFSKG